MNVRKGLPGKMSSEQKRAGAELRGDQGRVVQAGGMQGTWSSLEGQQADLQMGRRGRRGQPGCGTLLALSPTAKRRNMGTMGYDQTPPYGRPSKTGFSARTHY